ncbi:hypothetical protein HDU98_009602 [Podochytrium sp. JEL0797]|nr:hypothetical protein HDU98_009602 [Podochytrium sp. JEL0797]
MNQGAAQGPAAMGSSPLTTTATATSLKPKTMQQQQDKERHRFLGNSAKQVSSEKPIDPTMTKDLIELQRLRNTKWLPPLSDAARNVSLAPSKRTTNASKKEEAIARLMNQTALPNIPLNKGRFPASELRKCHELRKHLKNNPNKRFLIELRDRANRIDEKRVKRMAELKKAQEANGNVSWDLLRPLSRDPVFGKFIKSLNEFGHELGYSYDTTDSEPNPERLSVTANSTRRTPETPSTLKLKPKKPNNAGVSGGAVSFPGIKCSVGEQDLDALILAIETSVFRAKRKGDCSIRGNEMNEKQVQHSGYQFGRPPLLPAGKGEDYVETFKQMTDFGHDVAESLHQSQKDKQMFSNITPARGGKKNSLRPTSNLEDPLTFPPPTPSSPSERRKNPSKQRRQDFLHWQSTGQQDLHTLLCARVQSRLEASQDKSRLQKVLDILNQETKVNFYLHSPTDPKHWMSVLPHIWVKESDELMKELENPILKLARRNMKDGANGPSVTAASIFKEREKITALIATHAKSTALAGHQRRDSIITAARRLDEYTKLTEGKDIVAERLATQEMFTESHLEALFGGKKPAAAGTAAPGTAATLAPAAMSAAMARRVSQRAPSMMRNTSVGPHAAVSVTNSVLKSGVAVRFHSPESST